MKRRLSLVFVLIIAAIVSFGQTITSKIVGDVVAPKYYLSLPPWSDTTSMTNLQGGYFIRTLTNKLYLRSADNTRWILVSNPVYDSTALAFTKLQVKKTNDPNKFGVTTFMGNSITHALNLDNKDSSWVTLTERKLQVFTNNVREKEFLTEFNDTREKLSFSGSTSFGGGPSGDGVIVSSSGNGAFGFRDTVKYLGYTVIAPVGTIIDITRNGVLFQTDTVNNSTFFNNLGHRTTPSGAWNANDTFTIKPRNNTANFIELDRLRTRDTSDAVMCYRRICHSGFTLGQYIAAGYLPIIKKILQNDGGGNLFISLTTNDIYQVRFPILQVASDLAYVIDYLKMPNLQIYFIFPSYPAGYADINFNMSPIHAFKQSLQNICTDRNANFIDWTTVNQGANLPDGLHPNNYGHSLYVQPLLNQVASQTIKPAQVEKINLNQVLINGSVSDSSATIKNFNSNLIITNNIAIGGNTQPYYINPLNLTSNAGNGEYDVSVNGEFPQYPAYWAVNADSTDGGTVNNFSGDGNKLVYTVHYPIARTVNAYQIKPHGGGFDPTTFTFRASTDGINFDTLDTRMNLSWGSTDIYFKCAKQTTKQYNYFQIYATALGGSSYGSIGQLKLYNIPLAPAFSSKNDTLSVNVPTSTTATYMLVVNNDNSVTKQAIPGGSAQVTPGIDDVVAKNNTTPRVLNIGGINVGKSGTAFTSNNNQVSSDGVNKTSGEYTITTSVNTFVNNWPGAVMDGDTLDGVGMAAPTGDIIIHLNSFKPVSYYKVWNNPGNSQNGVSWALSASTNDGAAWTTVDTRTSIVWSVTPQLFALTAGVYNAFKFSITANDGNPYSKVNEIKFFSNATPAFFSTDSVTRKVKIIPQFSPYNPGDTLFKKASDSSIVWTVVPSATRKSWAGAIDQTPTAGTTTLTFTHPATPDANYAVTISSLSADAKIMLQSGYTISNKTTTSFTVTFNTGSAGEDIFDWIIHTYDIIN